MITYISMLRGINVGGKKLIKMEALRSSYETMGFHNVTTYLQSGNVVFASKDRIAGKIEQKISRQMEKDFGFDVPVLVLTVDRLKQVIDNNRFVKDGDKNTEFLHVTFLSAKPGEFDPSIIEQKKQRGEEIIFSDDAVYLFCPDGYGNTRLSNNFLEAKLKVAATTRNWKTTNELLRIAQEMHA